MENRFLATSGLPFCKGCGHHLIARNTGKALESLDLDPMNVVIVTDIGCNGIIDRKFHTHTVHGLHGRSVALATGITLGLDDRSKKVIVFIGDGGATIGLQHVIEAAHRNVDITVIVHNNMLYGMTGGQSSGLTPCGFKTTTSPDGKSYSGYDLCRIVGSAGASYVRRIICMGDFSSHLAEAIDWEGFALVEAMEICPSYGVKYNPGRKLAGIVKEAGLSLDFHKNPERKCFSVKPSTIIKSLFEEVPDVEACFESTLTEPISIVLSGSAGGGVQLAAELLARAAMASGLHVTKKGNYPVTVGTGFSSATVIMSPHKILFNEVSEPDVLIVVTEDGLRYSAHFFDSMREGLIIADSGLTPPPTNSDLITLDFTKKAGTRNAAILSLMYYLKRNPVIPMEAFMDTLEKSRIAGKVDFRAMLSSLDGTE